jgi:two-component system, cell cycle response regulator
MSMPHTRVILIDPSDGRSALAQRLSMQGYSVEVAESALAGAHLALSKPPKVVVADLWMHSISGVQLCRLLRSEPATANVQIILRGAWSHRDRFWAEHAGASAYVAKGRMGDLVRAIDQAFQQGPSAPAPISFEPVGEVPDIRDRIASELDQALFTSVIASEVRALAVREDFEQLFDRLAQLVTRITSYRWLVVSTERPDRIALHCHPRIREVAEREARDEFGTERAITLRIEDEDPYAEDEGPAAIVEPIVFGAHRIGQLAVACRAPAHPGDRALVQTIARELGGPLRMVALVEDAKRQARVDPLTGLLNRRAFVPALEAESVRVRRYQSQASILVIDIDQFKQINDRHGHGVGDTVISAVGRLLGGAVRGCDAVARWGGEEFVALLPATGLQAAELAAERLRGLAERLRICTPSGERVPVTLSIGVAEYSSQESYSEIVDRADRAMYAAKTAGRNRVEISTFELAPSGHDAAMLQ